MFKWWLGLQNDKVLGVGGWLVGVQLWWRQWGASGVIGLLTEELGRLRIAESAPSPSHRTLACVVLCAVVGRLWTGEMETASLTACSHPGNPWLQQVCHLLCLVGRERAEQATPFAL
jgi:hypothetical protein